MVKIKKVEDFSTKLVPVLFLACLILAFLVGVLWQRVSSLEKNQTTQVNALQGADTANNIPTTSPVSLQTIKDVFKKDVVKFGDGNRKVLFIEVADPSCPYCHIAAGMNPELNSQAGDRFKLVQSGGSYIAPVIEMKKLVDQGKASFAWIYSPGHGNGEMGTKALYCAHEKGKFWEAHNLLMTDKGYELLNNVVRNDKSKSKEMVDFLSSAVEPSFLRNCLDSGKYDQRLKEDIAIAQSLGISGTPGFYVNTQLFPGAYNYTDLKPYVEEILK